MSEEITQAYKDGNLKIDFPASSFLNPTQLNINKIKISCPVTTDLDGDGVLDDVDNCFYITNSDQADENKNGVGDVCEEGITNSTDSKRFYLPSDVNQDDIISMQELINFIRKWNNKEAEYSGVASSIYEWQYVY